MFRFILPLLLLGLAGCAGEKKICTGWEKKIDAFDVSKMVIGYSADLEREHELFLEDAKVYYDENIQSISLWYKTQAIVDLCEARALLVEVVDGFLNRINQDPLISWQTGRKPMIADDLSITINFESFFTRFVDPLYIGLICLRDGIATYYAGDLKDNLADWSHQRVEPFYKSRHFAILKRDADMEFTEIHREGPKNVPHPFIFGKMISQEEADDLPQSLGHDGRF